MNICNITPLSTPTQIMKIVSLRNGSKTYYEILTQSENEINCCIKWNSKLDYNVDWKKVFKTIHKIEDVSLKWLQIRIVYRIIATNVLLKEMKVKTSELCSFCKTVRDSIPHMFWSCKWIQVFWGHFQSWISENCEHLSG